MPRIRSIKPEFFTSDDILSLTVKARLLYVGLWCYSDRGGKLKYKPKALAFGIMPQEAGDFDACMDELKEAGLVYPYEVDGAQYLYLPTFTSHQRPHHTEKDSNIPEFNGTITVSERLGSGRKGREGKGKERKEVYPSGISSELSQDSDSELALLIFPCVGNEHQPKEWALTQERFEKYQTAYPAVNIMRECQQALLWCEDNPSRRKTAGGMPGFLTRWLGKAQNQRAGPPAARQQQELQAKGFTLEGEDGNGSS